MTVLLASYLFNLAMLVVGVVAVLVAVWLFCRAVAAIFIFFITLNESGPVKPWMVGVVAVILILAGVKTWYFG